MTLIIRTPKYIHPCLTLAKLTHNEYFCLPQLKLHKEYFCLPQLNLHMSTSVYFNLLLFTSTKLAHDCFCLPQPNLHKNTSVYLNLFLFTSRFPVMIVHSWWIASSPSSRSRPPQVGPGWFLSLSGSCVQDCQDRVCQDCQDRVCRYCQGSLLKHSESVRISWVIRCTFY